MIKLKFMKPLIISLIFIMWIISINILGQDVDCNKINDRNGKDYIDGYDSLFTGTCVSYHENGKISFRGTYKDGETDGKCEWWYDSGQKMKEITYVSINGESLASGDYFVWFRNGQLMKKESFKMGTRDGDWIQYDINGKLIKKGTYKDGMHISGDKIVEVLN